MIRRKKTVGLIAFLKGSSNPIDRMSGCANFDNHYGGCLFADKCKVIEGKRCKYFEKNVLPTTEDIGLKQCVYSQYAKHVGLEKELVIANVNIRECPDCGAELRSRRRYCDVCSNRRRRESYRSARHKKKYGAQHLKEFASKILQSKGYLEAV